MSSCVNSELATRTLTESIHSDTNTSAQLPDIPKTNDFFSTGICSTHILFGSIFALFIYQLITWLNSEKPPRGSGLKPIPGPSSTLPYLGRFHDLDDKHIWKSMKRFSDHYNGLFSMTLGGETHIWIGREDIAQDLICKNGAICGGRADLGAYPHVTQEFHYLPLMGYTGQSTHSSLYNGALT
jgi:hypothetical protein